MQVESSIQYKFEAAEFNQSHGQPRFAMRVTLTHREIFGSAQSSVKHSSQTE